MFEAYTRDFYYVETSADLATARWPVTNPPRCILRAGASATPGPSSNGCEVTTKKTE